MQWEYRAYKLSEVAKDDPHLITNFLNTLGLEGWELISVDSKICYFKRAISKKFSEWWSISLDHLPERFCSVCITPVVCFGGSEYGNIYKSENRGKSWSMVHFGTLVHNRIDKIFTEGHDNILAIDSENTLIGSRDGGQTWEYFEKNS